MKIIYTIFLFVFTITSQNVIADENNFQEEKLLIEIESKYLLDSTYSVNPCDKIIVIVDQSGNILREAQAGSNCLEKMPEIFKPLIKNCHFLTEIDGSSYFLYN